MKKDTRPNPTEKAVLSGSKDREDRHRMLFEHGIDAVFTASSGGRFLQANQRGIELTGYSRRELLRMNIRDLFPNRKSCTHPHDFETLSGGVTITSECVLTRKDGTEIQAEVFSGALPDGTVQTVIRDITGRRDAELSLLDTEIRYRNLHMSMMDGYVLVDMQGRILDSNEAYRQMLGYDAAELAELTYQQLTPERWHRFEQDLVNVQIIPKGHSDVYQKEYIRKDGTVFPVELRTFLVRNNSGTLLGMWGIVRDITRRKKAEEDLRQSEEKFRSIVECSPNPMHFYFVGDTGEILFTGANPAADTTLGIRHSELVGKNILEAFPSLAGTGIPEMYCQVALGEIGPQSFEIPYADKRITGYFAVTVFRSSPGHIVVNFLDITVRRAMEEAIRRSEIEYHDTIDSLPDWIYVVDHELKIVVINAALREELLNRCDRADCIGRKLDTGFPFITRETISDIREVFRSRILSVSHQKSGADGKVLHLEVTHVPIFKEGNVIKVVLMIRDRSKEKEVEEVKQRAAEQKEVLLREIHHRVKNNLAIVISLLNFQLRSNTHEPLSRMILDIQMRIRSMALIHEHLYRSENLDRIPLATYIDSLAGMIQTTFRSQPVTLDKQLVPFDAGIEIALPVGLIMNELLTNAFKYAYPEGQPGVIRIHVENTAGHECLLEVQDNGVGLPEEASLLAEKSVGLYIVHLLVEQIEGTLEIIRDHGATFRIRFRNVVERKKDKLQA